MPALGSTAPYRLYGERGYIRCGVDHIASHGWPLRKGEPNLQRRSQFVTCDWTCVSVLASLPLHVTLRHFSVSLFYFHSRGSLIHSLALSLRRGAGRVQGSAWLVPGHGRPLPQPALRPRDVDLPPLLGGDTTHPVLSAAVYEVRAREGEPLQLLPSRHTGLYLLYSISFSLSIPLFLYLSHVV